MVTASSSSAASRALARAVSVSVVVLAAACGDDEGVKSLDEVYAGLGGGGADRDEGAASSGASGRPSSTGCGLSASVRSSLLFYLPLDGDTSSRAGQVTVQDEGMGGGSTFGEGYAGSGLMAGSGASLALSPGVVFSGSLTLCAWVKPANASGPTGVLVVPMPSGGAVMFGVSGVDDPECAASRAPFVRPLDSCTPADLSQPPDEFTFVCWATDPSRGTSISTGGRPWVTVSSSPPPFTGELVSRINVGVGGGLGATVDEITLWNRVLTEDDLASLLAGGRACLTGTSSSGSGE